MKTHSGIAAAQKLIAIVLACGMLRCTPSHTDGPSGGNSVQSSAIEFSDQRIASLCNDTKRALTVETPPCPTPQRFRAVWASIAKHATWQKFASANGIDVSKVPESVMSRVYNLARQQVLNGSASIKIAAAERQELLAEIKNSQGDGLALKAEQGDVQETQPDSGATIETAGFPVVFVIFFVLWMIAETGSPEKMNYRWAAFAAWLTAMLSN